MRKNASDRILALFLREAPSEFQVEMQKEKIKTDHLYWKLFSTCFVISMSTFGGGLVIISMLQKKFVDELGWIGRDEMMDLIAIAQSCPGVMAVNSATIIGYHLAGAPGAVLTALGSILPPMIILSIISFFYTQFRSNRIISLLLRGMQAGVAAVLIHLSVTMSRTALEDRRILSYVLFAASVISVVFFGVDVIIAILFCGIAGGLSVVYADRKQG